MVYVCRHAVDKSKSKIISYCAQRKILYVIEEKVVPLLYDLFNDKKPR